jgi:hypothetical protein
VGYTRIKMPAEESAKHAHAFQWFHEWADWVEAIERVADHGFKSWVPHRLLHKGTRQIAAEGDLWCKSTSALEANQAEMGRTIDKVSSRRRLIDEGSAVTSTIKVSKLDGSHGTVEAKVTGAMAMSASRHFIAAQEFRSDAENRILQRGSNRLVLGPEARSTAPRTNPRFVKLPVDRDTSSVAQFVLKIKNLS